MGASSSNGFSEFPIGSAEEKMRRQLERSILRPLIYSATKNRFASVFEHTSCAGRASRVEDAMATLQEMRTPLQDCVFTCDSGESDPPHIVCMWLVSRKIAVALAADTAAAHPRTMYRRMRSWMRDGASLFVVSSRVAAVHMLPIVSDFGVNHVFLCENAALVEHPTRSCRPARRVPGLRVELCDDAARVCEEVRFALRIADTVLAPAGTLARRHEGVVATCWPDRGVQLRIRQLFKQIRIATRGCPRCVPDRLYLRIDTSMRIWYHPETALCPSCEATMRIVFPYLSA